MFIKELKIFIIDNQQIVAKRLLKN